jgi:hypothetical protein
MFKHTVDKFCSRRSRGSAGRGSREAGGGLFAGSAASRQRQEQFQRCLDEQARQDGREDEGQAGRGDEAEVAEDEAEVAEDEAEVGDDDGQDREDEADAELAASLGQPSSAAGSSSGSIRYVMICMLSFLN